jgi:AcrR family transcriptional regulator
MRWRLANRLCVRAAQGSKTDTTWLKLYLRPPCVNIGSMQAPNSTSSVVRPYRGIAASDRVASRRDALIRAGLRVFDTEGWSALSARRVCEVAGLTRRYFYESFKDLDELLAAIYVAITGEAIAAIKASLNTAAKEKLGFGVRVERSIAAGLATLDPPVRGRFLVAIQRAGGAIAPFHAAVLDDLAALIGGAALITEDAPRPIEPAAAKIAARMVVGAGLALAEGWFEGTVDLARDEIPAHAATAAVAIIEALRNGAFK